MAKVFESEVDLDPALKYLIKKTIYLSESSSNIANTEKTIIDNCQNDCANFFNKLLDVQDDWKLHWIKMSPENQRGAIFFIVTGEVDCSDPGSRCSCVGTWCVGTFDCLIRSSNKIYEFSFL